MVTPSGPESSTREMWWGGARPPPWDLAWTRGRVTNGALEGMNSKVKLVSHRAHGYRNPQDSIMVIYRSCARFPLPPSRNTPG
ncbi:MAG: transposase [Candidatus Rokubacteria bacterium]|nr:transposase [Candidatus Rokubacteria bacterium]